MLMEASRSDEILYLNSETVRELCDSLDVVSVIEEVLRLHGNGETTLPDEAYLPWTDPNGLPVRSLNMPGYVRGVQHIVGTKIINSNPANPKQSLPRASGVTLLFDHCSGRIRCIMEGAHISAVRTASVSTIAMRKLRCASANTLSVIGSGEIGRAHVHIAMRSILQIERIVLFDLDQARAARLAEELRKSYGQRAQVEVSNHSEEAVRAADLLVTATTVTEGYIRYEWLKPGAVVVHVSLDDLLPEVIAKADLVFVDDWGLVRSDSRRLLGRMIRSGDLIGPKDVRQSVAAARQVDAELADVVLGRHQGRRTERDIIVVNPFGLAIEDLALAGKVMEIAMKRGLGTWLTR